MVSSFFFLWQCAGVVMPFLAYMSFSQYSFSSARLTSTRPNRFQSPSPKSVTSQRGLGGSAQPCAAKQLLAERMRLLMALRFMGVYRAISGDVAEGNGAFFGL